MRQILHLKIAEPCTENWETMQPEDRGRFCAACQKTVVDLTGLSDKELLTHLARVGQGGCGRLSPEQVGRGMELDPARSRGWLRFWHWLMAGELLSAEVQAQQLPKAKVEQHLMRPETDTTAKDSIQFKILPEAVVYPSRSRHDVMGLYTVAIAIRDNWVKDSLARLGLVRRELMIYPNPVRRGNTAMLNWKGMENGGYEVTLISSSGALIQRRIMEVKSSEQVDLLDIPASLPEGIYFLRIASGGTVRVLTRKLVVL